MTDRWPQRWLQQGLLLALVTTMVTAFITALAGYWNPDLTWRQLLPLAAAATLVGSLGWRRPALWLAVILSLPLGALALGAAQPRAGDAGDTWPAAAARFAQTVQDQWHLWLLASPAERAVSGVPPELGWACLVAAALLAAQAIGYDALFRGTPFWSLTLGGVLFLFWWVLFFDAAERYLTVYVGAGLVLWAVAQADRRRRHWEAEGRRLQHGPSWVTGAAAVSVAALAASTLAPAAGAATASDVAERIRRQFPALVALRAAFGVSTGFDLNQVGFGGNTEQLGGPLLPTGGVALRVATTAPVNRSLYLRGTVHTRYTGRGWAAPEARPPFQLAAVPRAAHWPAGLPTAMVRLTVWPGQLESSTLFHLLDAVSVTGTAYFRQDADGNLAAATVQRRNQSYGVVSALPLFGADLRARIRPLTPAETATLAPYLSLPEATGLERVAAVTRTVTEGLTHPLDQAVALERFLRHNYAYTLTPPPPRRDRDFVYQFLAEGGGGYCTYFATALAVMLRQAGIPSRWVQGFVLPAGAVPDRTGLYPVQNDQAHAWVEAYLPGYGWLTLDPTPRADWPAPLWHQAQPGAAVDPLRVRELLAAGSDGALGAGLADLATRGLARLGGWLQPWSWLVAAAAAAAALGGTGMLWHRRRAAAAGGSRGRGGPVPATAARRAVQRRFLATARWLGWLGMPWRPAWTPQEYAQHVARRWPDLAPAAANAAAAYTAARYGVPADPLPDGATAAVAAFARAARRVLWRRRRTGSPTNVPGRS